MRSVISGLHVDELRTRKIGGQAVGAMINDCRHTAVPFVRTPAREEREMTPTRPIAVALLAVITIVLPIPSRADAASRRISRTSLEDKIRGGWAGQMIGVSFGAPTEFRSNGKIIEDNINDFMT